MGRRMTRAVLWYSNVNDHDRTSGPLVPSLSHTSAVRPISLGKILIAASPLRLYLPSSSLFRLHKNIKEISERINQQTTCVFTSRFFFIFVNYSMRKSSTVQTRGFSLSHHDSFRPQTYQHTYTATQQITT